MSIEWDRLDQPRFDQVVEALVRQRSGDSVRAVTPEARPLPCVATP
jgi:hypothetical protein